VLIGILRTGYDFINEQEPWRWKNFFQARSTVVTFLFANTKLKDENLSTETLIGKHQILNPGGTFRVLPPLGLF